jgi:hypothetical protein
VGKPFPVINFVAASGGTLSESQLSHLNNIIIISGREVISLSVY